MQAGNIADSEKKCAVRDAPGASLTVRRGERELAAIRRRHALLRADRIDALAERAAIQRKRDRAFR